MSKSGHRNRNRLTISNNSWRKQKFPTFIDKAPVEKQKEDALLPYEFQKFKHWWPHRCRCIDNCHFRSGLTKNSIARKAKSSNWGTIPKLSSNGSEWTFRNAERNSWTSIWGWGNVIQRTFHSRDQYHKSIDWTVFLQRNSTIPELHQGFFNFPPFSMQLKHADNSY